MASERGGPGYSISDIVKYINIILCTSFYNEQCILLYAESGVGGIYKSRHLLNLDGELTRQF